MAAPPARIPALDGLRGAAVCLIVLFHAFPRWFPGGFLGVDLFLVLSGMLIVDGLLAERARTGRLAIARFLARRALRLGPALLVLLAVYLAYAALTGGAVDAALMDAALVLGGVANWSLALGFERPGLLAHGWSLAVEQQFYLVCPGLVLLLSHRRLRAAAPVLLIVMIVALAAWRAHLAADGASAMRLFTGLDTRGGARSVGRAGADVLSRARAAAPGVVPAGATDIARHRPAGRAPGAAVGGIEGELVIRYDKDTS